MNFLDWFRQPKKTLKIFDDVILEEGEIINIYGEPYVGKTLMCYHIIKNNPNKTVMYLDSENSLYNTLENIGKKVSVIYSLVNDLSLIKNMLKINIDIADYFIIDSITATDMEDGDKVSNLLQVINMIQIFNKNLIIVSQVRGINDRVIYENKKYLDYMAYKAEVKSIDGGCIVNNKYKINLQEVVKCQTI